MQILATVLKMQAHGSARAFSVLVEDRLIYLFMLVLHALFIVQRLIMKQTRRIQSTARNDDHAQVDQCVGDVVITCRLGNAQMELKIQRCPVIDTDGWQPELIEKPPQPGQLIRTTSLGAQPGGFYLKTDSKLHDRKRIIEDAEGSRVDECPQRQGAAPHKCPDPVTCLNHSSGL